MAKFITVSVVFKIKIHFLIKLIKSGCWAVVLFAPLQLFTTNNYC